MAVDTTEPAKAGPISVPVFTRLGVAAGTIDIDPAEFGGEVSKQLLHDVVVMYMANQRGSWYSRTGGCRI